MSNASINTTILPEGYTRLQFIEQPLENSGYFKSGVYPTSDTRFTVDFMAYDAVKAASYHCLFGLHLSAATTHYYYTCAGGSVMLKVGGTSVQGHFANRYRVYADYSGTSYVCNGTTETVSGDVSGTDELPIFCKNYSGSMTDFFHGRLYYLQFRDGERIIRNYVPCKDSNNVVGLFETVNWEFVTSETEDAFVAGPVYPITPQVRADNILSGVEDVRAALKEYRPYLGNGMVTTLGDDVRAIRFGGGIGFQLNGGVRHSEEVEVEVEDPDTGEITTETVTEYTYPVEEIFNGSLIDFTADSIWTDVIDNLGELKTVTQLSNGNVKFVLDTGITLTVDPNKTYIRFKDPVVENIIVTNWGTDGKITLAEARAITGFNKAFADNTEIKYFNEFKYFDGVFYESANKTYPSNASREDSYGIFHGCTALEEIKLSPNHTSLGWNVFMNCSSLKKINFPDGFTNLGHSYVYSNGYFVGCDSLEEVYMPDSVRYIASNAFYGCENLKKIRWSSNLPYRPYSYQYGDLGFTYCPNLETVENFPQSFDENNTTNIRSGDFHYNHKLNTIFLNGILSEATGIGANAFRQVYNFFSDRNGYVSLSSCTSLGNSAFYEIPTEGNILELPSMTDVNARYNGRVIGKIILNENVTNIKANAFANNELEGIILPATTPPTIENVSAFADSIKCPIYVPAESVETYKAATNWSSTTNNIVDRIWAYKDPSTATFCDLPTIAPVPTDYTRMKWIGTGYSEKLGVEVYNQILLDYAPSKYAHLILDISLPRNSNSTGTATGNSQQGCFIGEDGFVSQSGASGVVLGVSALANSNRMYQSANDGKLNRYWYFNPLITGEDFYERSILKINRSFIQFHGETHQKVEQDNDWTYPISLFGYKASANAGNATNLYRKTYIQLFRFSIYEPKAGTVDYDDVANYELVKDYIPVMRNSDRKYGLWERINGVFFTGANNENAQYHYGLTGAFDD